MATSSGARRVRLEQVIEGMSTNLEVLPTLHGNGLFNANTATTMPISAGSPICWYTFASGDEVGPLPLEKRMYVSMGCCTPYVWLVILSQKGMGYSLFAFCALCRNTNSICSPLTYAHPPHLTHISPLKHPYPLRYAVACDYEGLNFIDGTPASNCPGQGPFISKMSKVGGYANSPSGTKKKPNCRIMDLTALMPVQVGKRWLILWSTVMIDTAEEILLDYGPRYVMM